MTDRQTDRIAGYYIDVKVAGVKCMGRKFEDMGRICEK